MQATGQYDCAIVGGGVAGLCLAIQLAQLNHSVILFEKNKYPFHKVCGEYVSNESRNFLEDLGLPISGMNLPQISQLGISSPQGYMLNAPLASGGFGISRHELDSRLFEIATRRGVTILEECKVHDVTGLEGHYIINTAQGLFRAKVVCGSYGKHSPVFVEKHTLPGEPNYIGVKYHIKTTLNSNRIELHNFRDGYCGVSQIENSEYCLCYLTAARNLKENNNDIKQLERNVLMKNPLLKKYFLDSQFLFNDPLVISRITFKKKGTANRGLFLLGDAAGAIAPLCGNGMSMGMRASKIATPIISRYLNSEISLSDAFALYQREWNANFSKRIHAGYYIQQMLGKNYLTDISLRTLKHFPGLVQKIITLTHGEPF